MQFAAWNEKMALAKELGSLIREGGYAYPIYKVLLFGSVATGDCRVDSDIDMAVIFDCLWSDCGEAWLDQVSGELDKIVWKRYAKLYERCDRIPFHFTLMARNRFENGNGQSAVITAIHEDGIVI
mgnify:CR=1 FL=1